MSRLHREITGLDAAARALSLGRRRIPDTTVEYEVLAKVEKTPSGNVFEGKKWRVHVYTPSGITVAWYGFRTRAEAQAYLTANEGVLRDRHVVEMR